MHIITSYIWHEQRKWQKIKTLTIWKPCPKGKALLSVQVGHMGHMVWRHQLLSVRSASAHPSGALKVNGKWPRISKALFQSTDCSKRFTTLTRWHKADMQGADLLIGSNLGFSISLKDTSACNPATFRLLDDPLYLLCCCRLKAECLNQLTSFIIPRKVYISLTSSSSMWIYRVLK